MIVDVSMYQTGLTLDDLPDHVTGVIAKASQGTYEDPAFRYFLTQARADIRWKYRGLYHFLSDKGPEAEAQFFLTTLAAVGGLQPGEFVVLDWENNAITGYRPPMADARAWMIIVNQALPGRVAWYSYRSNAIKARNSGDFPWPLWLSDPNADGAAWALALGAFLLQSGQQTMANINIDVNDIIDIATLDDLTGDDMALSDDDVKRIAEAVWSRQLDAADWSAPAGQFIGAIRDELLRDDKLTQRVADAVAVHGGVVSGGASPGQVADELARRLTA